MNHTPPGICTIVNSLHTVTLGLAVWLTLANTSEVRHKRKLDKPLCIWACPSVTPSQCYKAEETDDLERGDPIFPAITGIPVDISDIWVRPSWTIRHWATGWPVIQLPLDGLREGTPLDILSKEPPWPNLDFNRFHWATMSRIYWLEPVGSNGENKMWLDFDQQGLLSEILNREREAGIKNDSWGFVIY